MKRIIIPVVILSSFLFSCNKPGNTADLQNEEVVEVPIVLSGLDLSWSQEPMSRADEKTVYFFSVSQDGHPYAWYCMESFEDVSISLLKNHTYEIIGYVAYNIKGTYYWRVSSGSTLSQGRTTLSNGVEYSEAYEYHLHFPLKTYDYKMLACLDTFTTIPNEIVLNMYNVFFGVKLNATHLDGTLEFVLENDAEYSYNYTITLTKEQPSATQILHFLRPRDVVCAIKDNVEYTREVGYTLKYIESDGTTSILHSGTISISRMKYTVVNIDMSSYYNNNSAVSLSLENENLTDGQTYNLNI